MGERKTNRGARMNAEGRSGNAEERRADGGTYTPDDIRQFEYLTGFADLNAPLGSLFNLSSENAVDAISDGGPVVENFEYTDGDAQAFDRLMERLNDTKTQFRKVKPRSVSGYTEEDDRLFSALTATIIRQSESVLDEQRQASETRMESVFHYTDQDDENFRKLMPISSDSIAGQGGAGQEENNVRPTRKDRDVGVIRVIDFDKQNTRGERAERRSDVNMKIRYFD